MTGPDPHGYNPPPANPAQPHPQQVVYVQQQEQRNDSALAPVTSIGTGLAALAVCWIPLLGIIAWVLAPLGIVFGIMGMRRGQSEHQLMSVIGLIAASIALLVCFGYAFLFLIALAQPSSP